MLDKSHPFAEAIREAYKKGEGDEMLTPMILEGAGGEAIGRIRPGDYVIFYDIRGEREIEITRSLTEPGFNEFPVAPDLNLHFVTMIEYQKGLDVKVAFPPENRIKNTLSQAVADAGIRQVKIVEMEKYPHLTFFFNGKNSENFPGEEKVPVPSVEGVTNYDECPEMSAAEVTAKIVEKIADPEYGFIVANLANVDVVGHIENREAIGRAVAAVDDSIGKIAAAAKEHGVALVITADHGSVEKWWYDNGAVDTGHTDSKVPFIYIDPEDSSSGKVTLAEEGELSDVAPTILKLLGLEVPSEMTGKCLLKGYPNGKKKRVAMIIADGWGLNDSNPEINLITRSQTPEMDRLFANHPFSRLAAAGEAVGLPEGTVGNSEVGHLHLGAGRRICSDRLRIDNAIADGSFKRNEVFIKAMQGAKEKGSGLHLMGIVSFFSSHGSLDHLFALLEMAAEFKLSDRVYLHAVLGRRGEQPESGATYMQKIADRTKELKTGRVVTVMGRYWMLDRENNWDRVQKAYRAIVYGDGCRVAAAGEF